VAAERRGIARAADQLHEDGPGEGGYLQVATPHIGSKQLYVTSGHYEKYGQGQLPADQHARKKARSSC
jgi:threonyl-tRNA synthetase